MKKKGFQNLQRKRWEGVSLSLSVNRAILLRYIFMLDIMYDFLLAHYFVKIIYILFQVTSLLYPATLPKHTHIPLCFCTQPPCPSTHIPLCFCTKPPCPSTHTYPFVSVPSHLAQAHTHTPLFVILLLFSHIELYIKNYNINLNIQMFCHLHISNILI
jgi:hypothetical protein